MKGKIIAWDGGDEITILEKHRIPISELWRDDCVNLNEYSVMQVGDIMDEPSKRFSEEMKRLGYPGKIIKVKYEQEFCYMILGDDYERIENLAS